MNLITTCPANMYLTVAKKCEGVLFYIINLSPRLQDLTINIIINCLTNSLQQIKYTVQRRDK